jgi:uncharacterized membrane protein YraQ (UPF0718 family)
MSSCCHEEKKKAPSFDKLLWISAAIVATAITLHFTMAQWLDTIPRLSHFAHGCYELFRTMLPGLVIGILAVGLLGKVPREFVISILGKPGKIGVVRATLAGVLLDLCSHGILMVGTKLYERGATLGQMMAFLIASPWNSFSLTLILWALIGLKWTLLFIALSMVIGIVTGLLFDALVQKGVLPANPHQSELPENFRFWQAAKAEWQTVELNGAWITSILTNGLKDGQMVLRWAFFGIVLASLIRAAVPLDLFQQYLGPTLLGLAVTLVFATVIEVCSEGSSPIAADILNRAGAPGNGFAFLMAGVATDYTEVMVVRDTTKSWKIALFLPLLTLPQVFLVGWLINQGAG